MLYAGRRKKSVKNLIYFFGLAALCVIFVIVGVRRLTMTSVALEQQTVCGKEEHVHGEECYDEYGILRCEKEEHIHGNDCYLILLADNDINVLLVDIDESENHSLESVVEETVSKAVEAISSAANTDESDEAEAVSADTDTEAEESEAAADAESDENTAEDDTGAEVEDEKPPDDTETADEPDESDEAEETEAPEVTDEPEETEAPAETEDETQLVLDKDTISAINEAIASDGETPDLVLNEDANVSETVTVGGAGGSIAADASAASAEATDEPEATEEPEETESPEVTEEPEETEAPAMSLTAVGDSETNNAANVFIYLDGS
ncbi:MAG: hypothetical protein LUF26_09025 [Firmicutes bacterium]|nr:hypothetical protein [Bacillota bacterium]